MLSGPLGVGKTTLGKHLLKTVNDSKLIHGDDFFHEAEKFNWDWYKRIEYAWERIVELTNQYLKEGHNVILDFVVEDELKWFCKQFSPDEVTIKYIVLMTNKDTIVKRLKQRDEVDKYKERSFFLLDKINKDPKNKKYFYDATTKTTEEIASDFLNSSKFRVKN